MADIQSGTAEIRRGKKEEEEERRRNHRMKTSGYAMVIHGRPKTPKNTSFLGVTQPPGVVQPQYSRGHD